MKTILVLGAGKSATVLIDFLVAEAPANNWRLIVADASKHLAALKTGNAPNTEAVQLDINDELKRAALIERAHVVVSMMPPDLHFLVAKDCVEYRKHLLTASYLDKNIESLRDEIINRKLLFISEMGLDPGLDHMSAMKIFNRIHSKGGVVTSFKSHCGGLVAPESDNNPWRYKISWNPRNVVLAGKAGASYKLDGAVENEVYESLFNNEGEVLLPGSDIGPFSFYPNRDSLSYIELYNLQSAETFIRTTLRHPAFMRGWNKLIKLGITSETKEYNSEGQSLKDFFGKYMDDKNLPNGGNDPEFMQQMEFLGRNDAGSQINLGLCSPADVLQMILEKKLALEPADKDMIVMIHEIEYRVADKWYRLTSSLIVEGSDALHTAMAKTVGLPLAMAVKLILTDKLTLKGLHIPVNEKIYTPVLDALEILGIVFKEHEEEVIYTA